MELYDIRVNHLQKNLLVSGKTMIFEWKIKGGGQAVNIKQNACRIRIYDTEGNPVADTGLRKTAMLCGNHIDAKDYSKKLQSDASYTAMIEVSASAWCPQKRTFITEKITGNCTFETGLLSRSDWRASFIGEVRDHEYHLYQKIFQTKRPAHAKLYVLCAGAYYGFLNDKPVNDHFLDPAWSAYDKSIYYTACDVTEKIREGDNRLIIALGDSMYNVPGGRYVYFARSYGKAGFALMLRLTYNDGTSRWILSDESWKMAPSPVTFSCIYGGEDYDGRLAEAAKSRTAFQEQVYMQPFPSAVFRESQIPPLKAMEKIAPVAVKEQKDGTFLYDFGKNLSGRVQLSLRLSMSSPGRKIILRPAENLGPDGRISQKGTGEGYTWNYICGWKKEELYAPLFTYTGFRYVEASGIMPEEADLLAEFIYPDCLEGDSFESSDKTLNAIWHLIRNAVLSNTKSYFTDCPTREKLPWLEQTHLTAPAVMDLLDARNIYEKILQDMEDAQHEDGLIPDIAPEYVKEFEKWNPGYLDSPEWGSAIVLATWQCYLRYGDLQILKDHYPSMKRYTDYLIGKAKGHMLSHGLGDWLDEGPCKPYSQNTPIAVSATAVYAEDLLVMEKVAALLGMNEDRKKYKQLHLAVQTSFDFLFLDRTTGRVACGSQACQAMSLCAGLVPDDLKEKVMNALVLEIQAQKGAITAGDVGHSFLVSALLRGRRTKEIWSMLRQDQFPGYAWQVRMGATTLTEEWDGADLGNIHGSQNHLMLGEGLEWLMAGLGGCDFIDREDLPFDVVRIAPLLPKGLSYVKICQNHPFGKIRIEWKKRDSFLYLTTEIPAGLTALICDPSGVNIRTVGSGRWITCMEI